MLLGSKKPSGEWKIHKEYFCDLYLKSAIDKEELSYEINNFLNSNEKDDFKRSLFYLEKAYITFNKTGKILDFSDFFINDYFDVNPRGKTIQDFLGYKNETKIVFNNWLKSVWAKKIPFDDVLDLIPNQYFGKKNQKIGLKFVPFYDKHEEIDYVMCIAGDITREKNLEMIASKGQEFTNMMVEIFNRPNEFIELIQDCRHNFDLKKNYGHVDMHFFMR